MLINHWWEPFHNVCVYTSNHHEVHLKYLKILSITPQSWGREKDLLRTRQEYEKENSQ